MAVFDSEEQKREDTLKDMARRHEAFREIIDRFGLLLRRQLAVRDALDLPKSPEITLSEEEFLTGVSLVEGIEPTFFIPIFRQAATQIWPALGSIFPDLQETLSRLEQKLDSDEWIALVLKVLARSDAEAADRAAEESHTAPDFMLLCLQAAWMPVMSAVRPLLLDFALVDSWRKAHCPICGSEPDMAVLENHPDPSEFLISKSGEVWHHCPTCLHRWRFVRVVCPACDNHDHKQLTRFSLPDAPQEFIYACENCRQYLPCVDLVESSSKMDFDLAALGLIHLDAAAQSKGYAPLSPAPWTALGIEKE